MENRSNFILSMSEELSHIKDGQPSMVDVTSKDDNLREAKASALVKFPEDVFEKITESGFTSKKGPLFDTARLAGVMAVKRTDELIPLCHALPVSGCEVTFHTLENAVRIQCSVRTVGKTGVEMEALTGASVAALTLYDMTKALSHDIVITQVQLEEKTGGKRDFKRKA